MLRVETAGFKVFLAAQVDMTCSYTLLSQVQLDSMEQACTDALPLPCGLYVEPVELYFGGTGNGVIADAADHTVMLDDYLEWLKNNQQ